jgi:hypothetical protein
MKPAKAELEETASRRYVVSVIGGDAVFIADRRLGQRIYMGSGKPTPRAELRRYMAALNHDLSTLSEEDFLAKYHLSQ